jgi:type IV fimbrial biogenesis protein FimT
MKQRAFTLIEVMISIAILGIVMAIAVPSYLDWIDKNQLKDAVETFNSSLQRGRSISKARSENIFINVTVNSGTNAWCFGLHAGTAACSCTTANSCNVEQISSSDAGHYFSKVKIKNGNTISGQNFDNVRGLISGTGGSITFISDRGKEATINLNAVGNTILCSTAGSTYIGDYPSC